MLANWLNYKWVMINENQPLGFPFLLRWVTASVPFPLLFTSEETFVRHGYEPQSLYSVHSFAVRWNSKVLYIHKPWRRRFFNCMSSFYWFNSTQAGFGLLYTFWKHQSLHHQSCWLKRYSDPVLPRHPCVCFEFESCACRLHNTVWFWE